MKVKARQMKIKDRPDYFFNDNMIVNIKGFNSMLLEINKLYHSRMFLVLIFTTLNTALQKS